MTCLLEDLGLALIVVALGIILVALGIGLLREVLS
jgi:hypothetical protein